VSVDEGSGGGPVRADVSPVRLTGCCCCSIVARTPTTLSVTAVVGEEGWYLVQYQRVYTPSPTMKKNHLLPGPSSAGRARARCDVATCSIV
jgi:hypothetical protein